MASFMTEVKGLKLTIYNPYFSKVSWKIVIILLNHMRLDLVSLQKILWRKLCKNIKYFKHC